MWSVPHYTLDTNIAVYAFTDVAEKGLTSRLVLERSQFISVQVLNEFANVAHRKHGRAWPEIRAASERLRRAVPKILPLDESIHADGLRIAEEHRLSLYDSLLLASALSGGARTFYSEDMQHGMTIYETLRIVNPFVPGALDT
ncbi:MAG TPA: PIN domain-containing protein [Reyranella sp.]|nr:PIN domain-containing protein [Reyranella sp.]